MRGPLALIAFSIVTTGITPHVRGPAIAVTAWGRIRDYPACAGPPLLVCDLHKLRGSPPHVRGPLFDKMGYDREFGITPACAGTTTAQSSMATVKRDHPRMCGDHYMLAFPLIRRMGSPPHVRGPL